MTDEVKPLSDDALREIERIASVPDLDGRRFVTMSTDKRDALCATVRVLRASMKKANDAGSDLFEANQEYAKEDSALREQLAQAENEREILRTDLKYRCELLEELRRCRDRWLTMLNPPTGYESVDDAIRLLQDQLAQVTQERDAALESLHDFTEAIAKDNQRKRIK